jgi:RHS repeat-associated protein
VRCKPVGMTNQIVQAASPPALAKNARTGHPLFRNRKGKPGKLGHPPSTDYSDYAYDSNTGRMTGWTFQVNSVTETGALTWNDNWSLEKLVVTDGFNSGGTQTCSFNPNLVTGTGYDDLSRLIGSSCGSGGSIWNQADTYDQYDNICKTSTGFVSWCPTYSTSPSNNHFTGTGVTYDSNGNVTNDGTTAYTWNEFSKMKKANGTQTLVYDAFGRVVEIDASAGNVEIWYTQLGKTAYMNGATYVYAYAPAPGGGSLLNTASGNLYMHKDWLGNARIVSSVPSSGNGAVSTDRAYAPYGEIYDIFGSTAQNEAMFTGDTQDVLAGTYDTPNRELQGSQQGRWLSPDPSGAGWNQYAYAMNPNSFVDPSGLNLCPAAINQGCGWLIGFGAGSGNEDLGGTGLGPTDNSSGLDNLAGALAGTLFNVTQYVFSASLNFAWGDYDLNELLTYWNQGEIELLSVTSLGVVGFSGNGTGAGNVPAFIPTLRLVPKSDYCSAGDRHIFYRVQTLNSNNTLGAIPSTPWYVTEQQTVQALAGPNGTSTDPTGNQFDDWISGAGQNPAKSFQTFTVAQSLSANATSYSIMVRIGNQDYGTLGIYTSNPPIVQGVQCPASLAHP